MRRIALPAVCSFLALAFVGCAPQAMLLVTQYPDGSPRVAEMEKAIRNEFKGENVPYRFVVHNMNSVAHPGEAWRNALADVTVVHMRALKPGVVLVAGDDAACYFAQRMLGSHYRFVFFDVKGNPADYQLNASSDITGVKADVPVRKAFALMKELSPSARGVGVLADNSLEGNAVVRKIEETPDLPIRVVAVKRAGNVQEWMDAVRDLQDKADVLCIASYSSVLADPKGNTAVPAAELLRMTSQVNRRPDFSFWKEAVGPEGVMAAVTVPVSEEAAIAARMAIRILYYHSGRGEIPIAPCDKTALVTSAERAAQLGIKKLPEKPAPESKAPPEPPEKK